MGLNWGLFGIDSKTVCPGIDYDIKNAVPVLQFDIS
jgi:hypothetical protein